jgi:L-histidine Nalpha-methyltransferase
MTQPVPNPVDRADRPTAPSRPAPSLIQLQQLDPSALAREAIAGLQRQPAQVSPKFFYDELGSHLFDAITRLDEYDLTRTEAAIFRDHGAAIGQAVQQVLGAGYPLLDLGAGDGAKAASLFPVLQPGRYIAVDISVDYLRGALSRLQAQHPDISMLGLGLDFSAALDLPAGLVERPGLVFYPGSSIGNFLPEQALRLLRDAHRAAAGGALLIGVDLVKPVERMVAAYDDALGVTAAFNLNLLRRLNALLGCNFELRNWRHVARYDTAGSRIEMLLEARVASLVRWPGGERQFEAGERIHTENACKWRLADFRALLHDAGFAQVQHWTDARGDFAVLLAVGASARSAAR